MTFSPTFYRFLALFAIVAGGVFIKRLAVDSYVEKELYRKDFIQEYVMGKAVLDGEKLYPPMPELIAKYFDSPKDVPWKHPAPHTAVAAVLSVPMGFFSYRVAVSLWIVVELCCLACALELLARWWGGAVTLPQKIVLFMMSLSFGPVVHELWYGQFSMVLLLSLILSWLALRQGRDAAGGAFLGFAVALKLTAWPVGAFLLLRGRWRAVAGAAAVALGLNLLAVLCVGWDNVATYFLEVGPEIKRQYRQHDENFSLWTVGGRFFSPKDADVASNFITASLYPEPALDRIVTNALPLVALVAALILAWRCRQFDSSFGILLCAGLPINPIVWDHYLLLTAIPIAIVFRRLKELGFPKGMTTVALVCLGITVFPNPAYLEGMKHAFSQGKRYNVDVLPFAAGLITYLPLVPLIAWIVLLTKTDGVNVGTSASFVPSTPTSEPLAQTRGPT